MANTFFRKPIIGADNHSWAPFNDAFIKDAIGNYSSYLYDDSGILKVAKGRIGISDGTNLGISIVDTITTIALSSVSNSYWAKIEMSVSGTAVTFSAANITGETDPSSIPAVFGTAWDGEKNGYYISTNKRLIGVVWKNSSGTLNGVVNVRGNDNGYIGSSVDDTGAPVVNYYWDKEKGIVKTGTAWGNPYNNVINMTKGRSVSLDYTNSSTVTAGTLFTVLDPYIEDGEEIFCHGVYYDMGTAIESIFKIEKSGANIYIWSRRVSTVALGATALTLTSGSAVNVAKAISIVL